MAFLLKIKKFLPTILAVGVLVLVFGFGLYTRQAEPYPELASIRAHSGSMKELMDYFEKVAKDKGALYAFDILRLADLPPKTDVHLLGHVVGDELYAQYGKDAVSYCTDEFRNACSHTVVVGLMLDFGEGALVGIAEACKKAPGGVGAYTMCFHGLGHGVLAFKKYDLEKTIGLCKKFGTKEHNEQEFSQCVGGAIMETISGGGHDRRTWESMRPKYLNRKNPLSPCDQPYMPEAAKSHCYAYLTPHLIEVAGGDLNGPDPKVFPKAFSFCRALPRGENYDTCIRSFGKEFITYARQSDGRTIASITDEELTVLETWCATSGNKEDERLCLEGVLQYMYWGGENDPETAVRFCSFLGTKDEGNAIECFRNISSLGVEYLLELSQREQVCSLFPEAYQSFCEMK